MEITLCLYRMVHLAIAVQLQKIHYREPNPACLLGSLAPDAIHMRPNTHRTHKRQTHFFDQSDNLEESLVKSVLRRYWSGQGSHPDEVHQAEIHLDLVWRLEARVDD